MKNVQKTHTYWCSDKTMNSLKEGANIPGGSHFRSSRDSIRDNRIEIQIMPIDHSEMAQTEATSHGKVECLDLYYKFKAPRAPLIKTKVIASKKVYNRRIKENV